VALHAGAGAAVLAGRFRELTDALDRINPRRMAVIGLGTVPAGLVGLLFERRIERELGTPETIAAGLLAGSVAMALADRCEQRRGAEDAGPLDAVLLGLAQATALVPGVSRNGAVLAAARWRRFTRSGAGDLSRQLAFPVVGAATLLKALRLAQRKVACETWAPLAAATGASFVSTRLSTRWELRAGNDGPLLRYAAYRAALGLIILVRLKKLSQDG
jgi:undecaprenyl-diphosphatase